MKKEETGQKRLLLLATGKNLFWKYGFKRVSVQEICDEAGVSKMTFYRFFDNKIELAKAVFDQELSDGLKKWKKILEEKSPSAEKVRKIIMLKQEGITGISNEFLNDFYKSNEAGLKSYVEERTQEAWNETLIDFRNAQKQGVFRKDLKPEFLFYLSRKSSEMIHDVQLTRFYKDPEALLTEFSNFFAYGISPHK